jgi:regulator of ribonuclease activity A
VNGQAVRNGWSGLVINGAVRDVGQLRSMNLGVKALGTCPRKSLKRNTGERDAVLEMFGVVIKPDMLIVADEDGVVVVPHPLSASAKL